MTESESQLVGPAAGGPRGRVDVMSVIGEPGPNTRSNPARVRTPGDDIADIRLVLMELLDPRTPAEHRVAVWLMGCDKPTLAPLVRMIARAADPGP